MITTTEPAPTTLLNSTVVGQPWAEQYRIGVGVDAVTGQLRAGALKPPELTPSTRQRTEYTYSLIESKEDLEQLVETSLKGSYNLEGVKVSGSTSFLEKVTCSDLAVTVVAEVAVEDSEYTLAPRYELDVVPGPDFRDRHGDYFVAGYRAGSSLRAVYQCRFTSSSQRDEFSATLAAEVPQVLTTEGSAKFERVASEHGARVNVEVVVDGVEGVMPPPKDGWTPSTILSHVIPWFNEHLSPTPRESYLEHYRMLDPTISGHVPIAPTVFAELGYLYTRFWTARAEVKTCPQFGRRLVADRFLRLEKDLEAHQASLATDPDRVRDLSGTVGELHGTLEEIARRQAFYSQVVKSVVKEPPRDKRHDADDGTVRWPFGYSNGNGVGVDVSSTTAAWSAPDKFLKCREHTFTYNDTSRIVVGWEVVCRRDEHGGDWEKRSDVIIGQHGGDVWVKGDNSRYASWKVIWYTVEAALYPAGPWTADGVHRSGFVAGGVEVTARDAEEYWTAERMQGAEPVAPLAVDEAPTLETTSGLLVEPSETLGIEPTTTPVADPRAFPARTVGKLFFRMNGADRCGSAVIVHRQGILTAAHCVLLEGEATDIVFVPAYSGGEAPFGRWAISRPWWSDRWAATRSVAHDVSFCQVLPRPDGQGVGDVVGWVGVRLGTETRRWDDVGYPARATDRFPFDGQRPWQSRGVRLGAPVAGIVTKADDLTQGASGGPWFPVDESTAVNGLNSAAHPRERAVLGPEFGDWVGTFYRHVFG